MTQLGIGTNDSELIRVLVSRSEVFIKAVNFSKKYPYFNKNFNF